MTKKRKTTPKDTESSILLKSKRRCAFCFHFDFDLQVKQGQIAHIDRNPDNCAEDNLAWLCLSHHDQYDSRPSQSKGLQQTELINAKNALLTHLAENHEQFFLIPSSDSPPALFPARGVSLDVFNIRIPVYRAFQKAVSHIVKEANISQQVLFEYARDINDALFLFDEELDHYLRKVFREGTRLIGLQRRMERPGRYDDKEWSALVDQETSLLLWFDLQLEEGRNKFNQYLNISGLQS